MIQVQNKAFELDWLALGFGLGIGYFEELFMALELLCRGYKHV